MPTQEFKDKNEDKATLKLTALLIIHKLLFNCRITLPTVMIAYIIEALQLAQFSLSRNIVLFSEPTATNFFDSILRCTTLDFIFGSHFSATIIFSFCNLFILLAIVPLLARLAFVFRSHRPMSPLDSFLINIVNLLFFLFRTVYLIPLMKLFFMSLSSQIQKEYGLSYSHDVRVLLTIIASISVFLYFFYLATALFMMRDPDPFSKCPFQGPLRCNQIVFSLLKISVSVYKFLDPQEKGFRIFLILTILVYLAWVVYRSQQANYYNTVTERLAQILPCFVFWFTLSKTLTYELPPFTDPFASNILNFFLMILAIQFMNQRFKIKLISKPFISMKSDQELQYHFLYLINAVEMIEIRSNRLILEGYLGNHILNCKQNTDSCSCRRLTQINQRGFLVKQQKQWYHLIVCLLKQVILKFDNSQRLLLLLSTLLKKRLNNKFAALYQLAKCQEVENNLSYNIIIFHNRQSIQYDMIKDDDISNQKNTVNINKFFEFNNLVVEFQAILEKCVNEFIQFWKQLIEASIDIKKLQDSGTTIIGQKENVRRIFDELNQLNPNNVHVLVIYASFLENVSNEEGQHQKLYERSDSIRRNLKVSQLITDQCKMKYGQNSQTAIFVISGNEHQLGEIQNINNQVKNLLGWTRQDLLGHNLSMIMPKVYGQSHDMVLNRYLSTSEDKFNCKERSAPALTKEGFMLPCTAMTKSLPNLQKGIQMVGFLSKMKEPSEEHQNNIMNDKVYSYILYRSDTEVVQGISRSCSELYEIPPSLVYGHPQNSIYQLKLSHIFVDSPEAEQFKPVLRNSPYVLKMDTSKIRSEFPVNFDFLTNRSLKEQSQQEYGVPSTKGVTVSISAQIKLQMVYAGVPLVMLGLWREMSKDWKGDEELNIVGFQKRKKSGVGSTLNSFVSMDQELKQIKQFKSFISEKRQPFSIKVVFNSALWFLITLFILSYLSYNFLQRKNQLFFDAVNTVNLCQYNLMSLSQSAYYLRKLHIYNTWLSQTSNQQQILNNTLSSIVQLNRYLEYNQFDLEPIKYKIQYQGVNPWEGLKGLKFNIVTHQIQTEPSDLETELYVFIANVNTLLSADIQKNNFSPYRPAYQPGIMYQTFILSIENVLFRIVDEQAQSTSKIVRFYNCSLNQCSFEFVFIMGISLSLLTIAMVIIVPYVISVNNINNRVLSLFGMIPLAEVQSFMSKCCQYLTDNLVEARPVDLSLKYLNNYAQEAALIPYSPSGCASPSEIKSPLPLLRAHSSNLRQQGRISALSLNKFGQTRNNERSEQFLKYSDNTIPKTIIQYGLITIIFAAYFVSDYFVTKSLFSTMQQGLGNFYNFNLRLQQLRHLKTCSIQSIIDPSLGPNSNETIKKITSSLIDLVYQTERSSNDLDTSQFSTEYSKLIKKINQDNVCSGVQLHDMDFQLPLQTGGLSQQECNSVENGLFQKGLHTVIISTLQRIRADLSANASTIQAKKQYLLANYPRIELIQKYTEYPILHTLKELRGLLSAKLEGFRLMELGKMVGFVLLVSVLYRVLWLPYLKELNVKIWRTKGMLNMIPMNIIIKNERLKNEFTSGILEKAVR